MGYLVKTVASFDRQIKRLLKKHPSIGRDIAELASTLQESPSQGISLGRNCYKIRLSVSSKGKGKSGGARVITCVVAVSTEVYLLSIYDKSEQDAITDGELAVLLQEIPTS